jgi:hypothetical protein
MTLAQKLIAALDRLFPRPTSGRPAAPGNGAGLSSRAEP